MCHALCSALGLCQRPRARSLCPRGAKVPQGRQASQKGVSGAAVGAGHWAKKAQSRAPDLGPAALSALGNLDLYDTKEFLVLNANFLGNMSPVNSCTEK